MPGPHCGVLNPLSIRESGVLVLLCAGEEVADLPQARVATTENHGTSIMTRLTISLSETTYRALREASTREGRSMASIVEESLLLRGIRPENSARDIVAKVRSRSRLNADQDMKLAVEETRQIRETT